MSNIWDNNSNPSSTGAKRLPTVFLDSNIVYSDPFFKKSFHKLLLELSAIEKIRIIISRVVFDELVNNYEKKLFELKSKLIHAHNELNEFTPHGLPDLIAFPEDDNLRDFLIDLNNREQIRIIEFKNDLLPILVERSIKRRKPFSDKKQEFRDAIIWLSYCDEVNNRTSGPCFFITNNTADFYDSSLQGLHTDLKADCDKIQVYKSVKEFINSENDILEITKNIEFEKWLYSENVDGAYVFNLIESDFLKEIEAVTVSEIESIQLNPHTPGYEERCKPGSKFDLYGIGDPEIKIVGNNAIITSTFDGEQLIDIYAKIKEKDEDWEEIGDTCAGKFTGTMQFEYDKSRTITNFKILKIEIYEFVPTGI